MLRICSLLVLLMWPAVSVAGPNGRIVVIDGDTIDVGGVRVRLHGIDAPEQDQTCTNSNGAEWPCGRWVSEQVDTRFAGRRAKCSTVTTDRYGRIVATCNVGGRDLGQVLVSDGLAFAYRKYSLAYDLDEKAAAVNNRGLHASKVQSPSDFRAARVKAVPAPTGQCRIKGNISAKGVRIFHSPGQADYNATRINTAKGERWFCTVSEARAAGWRAAKR